MKFTAEYSIENDIQNHLDSAWRLAFLSHDREDLQGQILKKYSDENFKSKIKSAQTREEAEKVVRGYLDSLPQFLKDILPVVAAGAENILNKRQEEITELLKNIYQKPFPFDTIKIFITTAFMCSYSYEEKWFRTGWRQTEEKHVSVAKHELNHFMFYYYYLDKLTAIGVSKEKREKLKEAVAIFSNSEGNDKPAVKELENFLLALKGQPMDQIIEAVLNSKIL